MDQLSLGHLAEEFAALAAAGDVPRLDARVREEAMRWRIAPWTLVGLVAGEWDRTGVARVPGRMDLRSIVLGRPPLLQVVND